MRGRWMIGVVVLWGLAAWADAQGVKPGFRSYPPYPRYSRGRQLGQLTIEEQRQLGLTDEQIQKIADQRRDLEREREKIDKDLQVARESVRAAQADVNRLQGKLNLVTTVRLNEIFKSVMTEEQHKKWNHKQLLEQAKTWVRSYSYGLNLSEAQKDDLPLLLVPVLERLGNLQSEVAAAQEQLAALRRADKVDINAVAKAEKRLAEVRQKNDYKNRQRALLDAMRAGLLPDQVQKLDKRYRYIRR